MITCERLRQLLSYDPDTGVFVWLEKRGGGANAGEVAGTDGGQGYERIGVEGQIYPAHRLAWLFVHGRWPTGEIDHINGMRRDNRLSNLRDVPGAINTQNQRAARKDNKLGLLGVSLHRATGKYVANIFIGGKNKRLGLFADPHEGHRAYVNAKRALHAGCTL